MGQQEKYLTTHHERDQETGLDYRGARFYDSDIGRFLSVDPLAADFASWSPYNYVLGNPVIIIDPDGRNGILAINKKDKEVTVTANFHYSSDSHQQLESKGLSNTYVSDNSWQNELVDKWSGEHSICLLYTSDAADDMQCVDLGGRRII